MRAIVGLILVIGLVSCGDEEVIQEIVDPTSSEVEIVYADLKEQFTPQEYKFFIETIKSHCEEKASRNSGTQRKLRQRLSPEAYGLLFAQDGSGRLPFRIPAYTRHRNDRIRIAAREHDAIAIFRAKETIVAYIFQQHEATIFVEKDLNPVTGLYRIRVDDIGTGAAFRETEKDTLIEQIEELNAEHNGSDKPLPIELPAIPDYFRVLVFDENGEAIPPTPEEHFKWIFKYDEAPLATDAQVEHENQRRTPSAFDCIEN